MMQAVQPIAAFSQLPRSASAKAQRRMMSTMWYVPLRACAS